MRLTVVGCSGGHPGPRSACSSYLVEHQGFRLLLDLGSGSLGPLHAYVDPRDVDALFLTHLHGDHWLDLAPMTHARTRHPDGRAPPPLRVIAPVSGRSRIAAAAGKSDGEIAKVYALEDPRDTTIGPFAATVLRAKHPVETHAIRLSAEGASLVYTGDTAFFPELAAFARDADLLLAEAGFVDGVESERGVHLTASEAGELARAAGVVRLVVTHVPPWHDADAQRDRAAAAFGGPTELAAPGASYDVVARR